MRRTKTTRTTRNPRPTKKSPFSLSDDEMTTFGLFASSSTSSATSSSSSNLSPLALPFTVERSNYNKFNLGTNSDFHFNLTAKTDGLGFWSTSPNFQTSTASQGLSADSIRTATVLSTYSTFPNPITITSPNTHNLSVGPNKHVVDASFTSTLTASSAHNRSSVPAVNVSVIGPNQHVTDALFSRAFDTASGHNRYSVSAVNVPAIAPNLRVTDASFSRAFDTPNTRNWSSMNSSVTSGLEPVDSPAGYVFGVSPNTQPHKLSLGSNDSRSFNNDSRSFLQDYGSSQVSYSQSLSGLKYSAQADGSQGKEDSPLFGAAFGRPGTLENNTGPSIIGASHGIASPATSHGLVSSGFSNEHTISWNDIKPHYYFESRSVLYDSPSGHISPTTTKSQDISSTSPIFENYLSVGHNPLKEKESYQVVGSAYKSSLNSQVPDINSTEEVNSAAHVSEHLDHHNPGEDSPCWKGAPTHFSSSGSLEQESTQHPMKNLQNNSSSGEDILLPKGQSLHEVVENAASVVTPESLDADMIVKVLNNLSELLLRRYSRNEYQLKEQDHKALDHVIANLNSCMSSKIQQVDPAKKNSPPQQITSSECREERNNDQYGKKFEELQSAYVRDEGLPKDYNMVQKIKMVLDENLEFKEDLPSDPVLYKNLWLEAEAELCVSSFKARLDRAKREMGKAKALDLSEDASDIKKMSSSNFSPTASILLHEAAGSKTLKTHTPNISLPMLDDIGDVDNSVMARFNILKLHEQSISVNMTEKEPADVEASGIKNQSSGVAKAPHLKHLLDTDDAAGMHSHGNQKMQGPLATEDVDHAVLARLNILKSRGGLDPVNAQVSEEGMGISMMQNHFGSLTTFNASSSGWEYVDGWMNRNDYEQG